jgi:hypothetical protein
VKLAAPSIIRQQIDFIEDIDMLSHNNVSKICILAGTLSKPFANQILKASKPKTPHKVFTDQASAWTYVSST